MSHPLGAEATAAAFDSGVVARASERDVVRVKGPDAQSYLQGQCTQDLAPLAVGGAADAFVLSAQGKVVALVRIWLLDLDDIAVEVASGVGDVLLERLRKFKIRVKADLELVRSPVVEVRGPGSLGIEPGRPPGGGPAARAGGDVPLGGVARRGDLPWLGVDLLGSAAPLAAGLPEGDPQTFEAARIEAGVPAMGSELVEGTIPHESGIVASTVSFTKGCYTGQELVARIDARGARVPRMLRGFVAERVGANASLPRGSALLDGDREVGIVTSVAWSPWRSAIVGLCYLRREVCPPVRLAASPEAGEGVAVVVEPLPLRGRAT